MNGVRISEKPRIWLPQLQNASALELDVESSAPHGVCIQQGIVVELCMWLVSHKSEDKTFVGSSMPPFSL